MAAKREEHNFLIAATIKEPRGKMGAVPEHALKRFDKFGEAEGWLAVFGWSREIPAENIASWETIQAANKIVHVLWC